LPFTETNGCLKYFPSALQPLHLHILDEIATLLFLLRILYLQKLRAPDKGFAPAFPQAIFSVNKETKDTRDLEFRALPTCRPPALLLLRNKIHVFWALSN
jgi:hypothetical protein